MLKQFLIGLILIAACACASLSVIIAVSNAAEMKQMSQTNEQRGIKVTAILQDTSSAAKTWNIEVAMETHTQSLGDDLSKAAVLLVDGKLYVPLSWEGAPPGGHHRKGMLRFKAITPQPRQLELQIRLAKDPAPRNFLWRLQ